MRLNIYSERICRRNVENYFIGKQKHREAKRVCCVTYVMRARLYGGLTSTACFLINSVCSSRLPVLPLIVPCTNYPFNNTSTILERLHIRSNNPLTNIPQLLRSPLPSFPRRLDSMLQRSIIFPNATPGDDERSVVLRCDIRREGYISRQNGEGRGRRGSTYQQIVQYTHQISHDA